MISEEYICNTCDAGPWGEDEKGSNGKLIVKFHRILGHDVVEYTVSAPRIIFEREIWNDEDRENFKKFLREERLLNSGEELC